MTGLDVLNRCRSYEQDLKRLKVRKACAGDVLLRITRATDAQGHGSGGDKMADMTARVDALERAIEARKRTYAAELIEAMRLIGGVESPDIGVVLHSYYIDGCSYDAIAVSQRQSRDAVRSLHRRGKHLLCGMRSTLTDRQEYARAREEERLASHL